jgi:hypothetical protein
VQLTVKIPYGNIALDKAVDFPVQFLLLCPETIEGISVYLKNELGEVNPLIPPTFLSKELTFLGQIHKPSGKNALVNEIVIKTPSVIYTSFLTLNWQENSLIIEADTVVGGSIKGAAHIKARTYVYDKIELTEKNQHTYYQTEPLPLKEHVPEVLMDKPLYLRVKKGEKEQTIQAFRSKVSFGRGDNTPKRDPDVRLFQSLDERWSEGDIIHSDFIPLVKSTIVSRSVFELKFNDQHQLVYNHGAQTTVAVLPKINHQVFKQVESYQYKNNRGYESHSITLDYAVEQSNGINNINLFFEDTQLSYQIKYIEGVYAIVSCVQLPHIGHIYLFNPNYVHIDKNKVPVENLTNIRLQSNNKQWFIGPQKDMKLISSKPGYLITL